MGEFSVPGRAVWPSSNPLAPFATPSLVNVDACSTWSSAECSICLISPCISRTNPYYDPTTKSAMSPHPLTSSSSLPLTLVNVPATLTAAFRGARVNCIPSNFYALRLNVNYERCALLIEQNDDYSIVFSLIKSYCIDQFTDQKKKKSRHF